MAKIALGALLGVVVGMTLGAACGARAQEPTEDTVAAAAEAGLDPVDLAGAVNTTGLSPHAYLSMIASDAPSPGVSVAGDRGPTVSGSGRIECIIRHESGGDPNATNPRSKAAGLGQFLWSTWLTTPQGKAGLSPYDAAANLAAIQYMLNAGRALEFDAVKYYGC